MALFFRLVFCIFGMWYPGSDELLELLTRQFNQLNRRLIMEIRIQSVKFDADEKLLAFVEKKVEKLEKFFDGFMEADVTLSLLPDQLNKECKVKLQVPTDDIIVTRNAKSFEDAVVDCVDVLKGQLVKLKEKKFGR